MSKKDRQKELSEKANEPSTVGNMTRQDEDTEPSIFYRCVCPNCGKDTLNVIDSGVFTRSPALGITSDGEVGCSRSELHGDYELGIYCRACGHQVCSDHSFTTECEDEFLSEWVKSNGGSFHTGLRLPKVRLVGTPQSRDRHRIFDRCSGGLPT